MSCRIARFVGKGRLDELERPRAHASESIVGEDRAAEKSEGCVIGGPKPTTPDLRIQLGHQRGPLGILGLYVMQARHHHMKQHLRNLNNYSIRTSRTRTKKRYAAAQLKPSGRGREAQNQGGAEGGSPPVGKTQARNPTDKPKVGRGPAREGDFPISVD